MTIPTSGFFVSEHLPRTRRTEAGSLWRQGWLCLLLLALGTSLTAAPLAAQEEGTSPPTETPAVIAPEEPAAPDVTVPDATTSETTVPDTAAEPPLRLIYIPYEKLGDVFDQLSSKVVITYAEYLELVKRAGAISEPVKPETPALISSASYSAAVKGDVVEISAVLDCLSLQQQWAELPVQFGQAAVGELTTSGEMQVLLRGTGEGQYTLLLEKAGKVQVTLKLLVPVKRSPAGPSLELQVPPVGITTFSLTIPKPDYEITVAPRNLPLLPTGTAAAPEGSSQTRVSLGATEKITVHWTPQTGDRPEMDLLTTVTNTQKVSLRDGLVHTEAQLQYQILRGELTQLRIAVPLSQRILDVTSSARLQGWTVSQEEQRQVVQIQLLGAVKDALNVQVHTEFALPEETAAGIPLGGMTTDGGTAGVHALDVTREQGTLQLTHGEELTLLIREQTGLVRTEAAAGQQNQLSYRFFSPQFRFVVQTEPVQPVLDVQHETRVTFREQRVEVNTLLNYTISRSGLFHLDVELPEGLVLQGVNSPAMAEYQHQKETRRLSVVLKERTEGRIYLQIAGFVPVEQRLQENSLQLDNLPLVLPLGIRQEEGTVTLAAIESMELITAEDRVVSAQPVPLPAQQSAGTAAVTQRSAWKFQSRPVVIPVQTLRRPTRMTAETATLFKVEPSGILAETVVKYHIQHAGVEHFQIAVPASISERLQIEVVDANDTPILQKTPLESAETAATTTENETDTESTDTESTGAEKTDAASGKPAEFVVWQIQIQRPVTGQQRFKLTYDLPFTELQNHSAQEQAANGNAQGNTDGNAAEKSATEHQTVMLIRPLGLENRTPAGPELLRSSGEVLFQIDPALSVGTTTQGQGVEPIDLRELQLLSQSGQQAFRYPFQVAADPIQFQLGISRYAVESVVSTVVSRMLTEYVTGISQDVAVRTRMQVKSSQRQRLIVQLPAEIQPMQVLVDQEIRQLQKAESSEESGWVNYYLNITRSANSDQEFLLTIQYLQTIPALAKNSPRGVLNLQIPQLLTAEGAPAVVQQSRSLIWLPDRYVPIRINQPFQQVDEQSRISFVRGIQPNTDHANDLANWLKLASSSQLDFPADGRAYLYETLGTLPSLQLTYWNRPLVTGALSLALLLIALILMRTCWENKILVVLITATVLAVVLQFEPGVIKQGVHSARFGLVALGLIWVVHGLFQTVQFCREARSPRLAAATETESTSVDSVVSAGEQQNPEQKPDNPAGTS